MTEELTYHKAEDGMWYPDLIVLEEGVSLRNLGRFAVRAAEYLRENHRERYQALVRFGKLAETMQEVEEEANRMMDVLEEDYRKRHPPKESGATMEAWQLREQARRQAEEIVMTEIVQTFR